MIQTFIKFRRIDKCIDLTTICVFFVFIGTRKEEKKMFQFSILSAFLRENWTQFVVLRG